MHFHHHSSQHRAGRTVPRFNSSTSKFLAVFAVVVVLIVVTVKNHQNLTSNLSSSSSERRRAVVISEDPSSSHSPENAHNNHHHRQLHHDTKNDHDSENTNHHQNSNNNQPPAGWSDLFHKKLRTVRKISIPSQYASPVTLTDREQHHHKGSLLNVNKERVVLFDTDGDDLIHRVVHPSTNRDASVQDTNYYASLYPFANPLNRQPVPIVLNSTWAKEFGAADASERLKNNIKLAKASNNGPKSNNNKKIMGDEAAIVVISSSETTTVAAENNKNQSSVVSEGRKSIRFFVIGDFGGPGRQPQKNVAAKMAVVAKVENWGDAFKISARENKNNDDGVKNKNKDDQENAGEAISGDGSGKNTNDDDDSVEKDDNDDDKKKIKKQNRHAHDQQDKKSDRLLLLDVEQEDEKEENANKNHHHRKNNNNDGSLMNNQEHQHHHKHNQHHKQQQQLSHNHHKVNKENDENEASPHHDKKQHRLHQHNDKKTEDDAVLFKDELDEVNNKTERKRIEDYIRTFYRSTTENEQQEHCLTGFNRGGSEFLDFIVSTGDNFYESGLLNEFDLRTRRNFDSVYVDPAIADKVWFLILGNHDHGAHGVFRDVAGSIRYTLESPRRRFWQPASYFAHEFVTATTGAGGGGSSPGNSVFIAFLDTYDVSPHMTRMSHTQIEWLKWRLSRTTARWRFVVGHRPALSAGKKHGTSKYMQNLLFPLFKQYNVSAYFCGDDHQIQVIKQAKKKEEEKDDDGTRSNVESETIHVVSGGGSRLEPIRAAGLHDAADRTGGDTLYQRKQYGFVSVEVESDHVARIAVHHSPATDGGPEPLASFVYEIHQ